MLKRIKSLFVFIICLSIICFAFSCKNNNTNQNGQEETKESIHVHLFLTPKSDGEISWNECVCGEKEFVLKTATSVLLVKAEVGSSSSQYNDTVLSQMYIATICDLIQSTEVFAMANIKYQTAGGNGEIIEENLSIKTNKESLLITVSYEDISEEIAKRKLCTLIDVCVELVENEDLFPANISLITLG